MIKKTIYSFLLLFSTSHQILCKESNVKTVGKKIGYTLCAGAIVGLLSKNKIHLYVAKKKINTILNTQYTNFKEMKNGIVKFAETMDTLSQDNQDTCELFLKEKLATASANQKEIINHYIKAKEFMKKFINKFIVDFQGNGIDSLIPNCFNLLHQVETKDHTKGYLTLHIFYGLLCKKKITCASLIKHFQIVKEEIEKNTDNDKQTEPLNQSVNQDNQTAIKLIIPCWEKIENEKKIAIALNHHIINQYTLYSTHYGPDLSFFIGKENYTAIMKLVENNHQEKLNDKKFEFINLLRDTTIDKDYKGNYYNNCDYYNKCITELREKKILFRKMNFYLTILSTSVTDSIHYQHYLKKTIISYNEIIKKFQSEANDNIEEKNKKA